jgi:hypothetical protein
MAVTKKAAGAPVKGSKKKTSAFVIDCSKPVEDKIMEIGAFEKFLVDKIKVDNKPGAPCVRRGCKRGGQRHAWRGWTLRRVGCLPT